MDTVHRLKTLCVCVCVCVCVYVCMYVCMYVYIYIYIYIYIHTHIRRFKLGPLPKNTQAIHKIYLNGRKIELTSFPIYVKYNSHRVQSTCSSCISHYRTTFYNYNFLFPSFDSSDHAYEGPILKQRKLQSILENIISLLYKFTYST